MSGTGQPQAARRGRLESLVTLGWSGVESSFRQLLSLVFFFATVGFIQPSDFGVFSLALAINGVFAIFIDEPIGESLVQKDEISVADWNTGFTVNLLMAAGFFVATLLAALGWTAVIGESRLVWAVVALSGGSLVGALGNIHKAWLSRALQFRTIAMTTLCAQTIGGMAALSLAIAGFGYWALVANVLVPAVLTSASYWIVSPWKPKLNIVRETVRARTQYALYSIAVRSIYMLRDQSPLLIAGLLLNFTEVGFLGLALRIGRSVGQLFEDVTSRPLISLISRQQHDTGRFGSVLTEVLTIIGLLAVPGYVGLGAIGPSLVPIIFGAKWAPAGQLLPWVCVLLAGWLVLHITAVSLRARSLGRLAVLLTTPAAIADALLMVALARFGLSWVLMACAARAMLMLPLAVGLLDRRLGVPPRRLLERWGPPLLASLVMALMLEYVQFHFAGAATLTGLCTMIIAGFLLYLLTLLVATASTIGTTTMRRQLLAAIGRSQ